MSTLLRQKSVLVMASVAVVGLVASGCYGWWVASAPSASSPTGDAVVVHAGGQGGERLQRGLELIDSGAAPTLVVMLGYRTRVRSMCGQVEPFEVICPTPEPLNTVGEAQALARLAEERGWTRVVTVTSDYHLRRAVHLDAKCAAIDVIGVAAPTPRLDRSNKVVRVAKEMIALPVSWITSC